MHVRLGCFGTLLVAPFYIVFKSCEGLVRLFLAAMNALDRHNRRRAVRKAYERDRLAQQAAARAGLPYHPWSAQQPWQYRAPQPQDNPAWQPRHYR